MARELAHRLLLGSAGLLLLAGGVAHPSIPAGETQVFRSGRWAASHWLLTFGQALAVAGMVAMAVRLERPRDGLLWGGVTLTCCGLLVGVLGTLHAAAALPEAAQQPGQAAWTLGLGRVAMSVTGMGAVLLGLALVRPARGFGTALVVAGVLAVAAVAAFPASHPWMHDVVLRAGAILAAVMLVAAAARFR